MDYHAAKAFILDKLDRELSRDLTYHGIHHTLDVLHATEVLCTLEKATAYEEILAKTAALFHDSGFTVSNQQHEERGCEIVRNHLPRYGFSPSEVERICGMIMATKIPQQPQNFLEQILCDADLDYLGRDDFYSIGQTLFEELKAYHILETEEAWNRLQVRFLHAHHFFTPSNIRRRGPKKAKHLHELEAIVAGYEKK